MMKSILYTIFLAALLCGCQQRNASFLYERRGYKIEISEQEVIIIEGYLAKNKARLISVQKENNQWSVVQDNDITQYLESPVASISLNENWLVVDSDSRSKAVVVFKKIKNKWEYHCKIRGESEYFGKNALVLNDNTLFVGDFITNKTGAVFVYDLTTNPPSLMQTIFPPKELFRGDILGSGFGSRIVSKDQWLIVFDDGVEFTNDEIKRYNIYDKTGIWVGGKELSVARPSILVFKKGGDKKWIFRQDLFYSLPHPPNGILRDDEGNISSFGDSAIGDKYFSIAGNTIFLYDFNNYYVFGIDNDDKWQYKCSNAPPFQTLWTEQRSPYRIFYHFEHLVIDSPYSGHLANDGTITLYPTSNEANWQPIHEIRSFSSHPDKELLGDEPYFQSIFINKNILAAKSCWFLDVKKKKTETPVCTGKVAIYEILSEREPRCVFQMEAFDNSDGVLVHDL